jgi:glycosyltransferase involved in cell wall biosynthesis
MKIVYIITRADSVGGASIHVRDMARDMRERGHETTVLLGGAGPVSDQLEAAGDIYLSLRWLRRQMNPFRDALALAELIRVLRRLRPDVVSAHTAKAGILGRAACRLLGIPVIYTPHGWPAGDRMPPAVRALFAGVERVAARWCGAIICVCEYEKRLALAMRIATSAKLEVIHNGVGDISLERRARPGATPVRLCSVARFDKPKDHRTLLQAMALLREHPWELDLVGDGPRQARMRRLAAHLGLSRRVHFHGYLADPSSVLSQAGIFVLASRSEAFPRSILEAMRAGLPVVASDVGGVSEAVTHGANGLLVPAGDPPALASALSTLLQDPHLRQRMGQRAHEVFQQRFRLDIMAGRTLAVCVRLQSRTALPR